MRDVDVHQTAGEYRTKNANKKGHYKYCAMGILAGSAGRLKIDGTLGIAPHKILFQNYGIKNAYADHKCPLCERYVNDLGNVIIHLNDKHRSRFGQIAIYLQSLGC